LAWSIICVASRHELLQLGELGEVRGVLVAFLLELGLGGDERAAAVLDRQGGEADDHVGGVDVSVRAPEAPEERGLAQARLVAVAGTVAVAKRRTGRRTS
jgi:hypothetical protein